MATKAREVPGHKGIGKMREEWLLRRISELEAALQKRTQERDRLRERLHKLAEISKKTTERGEGGSPC